MNKKLVYQVGNNKKLYYDARPTKYQDQHKILWRNAPTIYLVLLSLIIGLKLDRRGYDQHNWIIYSVTYIQYIEDLCQSKLCTAVMPCAPLERQRGN